MMMATSTALALGVLATKPGILDAFVINPGPHVQHRSSGQNALGKSLNDGIWTGQAYPLVPKDHPKRSRSAMTGQPSRSGLSRSMSLAEWNQQRRISPVRRRSHQNNQLEDFTHVKAITGGVSEFMNVIDESLSGELVTVMTYMPWCRSCKHTRQRLRTLAEAHSAAGNGAQFYEMDLSANPKVHEMLDIHAAPTVLLYMSGQLVDEFVCGGDNGSRTLLRHIEAQIGPEPPRPNA